MEDRLEEEYLEIKMSQQAEVLEENHEDVLASPKTENGFDFEVTAKQSVTRRVTNPFNATGSGFASPRNNSLALAQNPSVTSQK